MSIHMNNEMDKLKKKILFLCAKVEENVQQAVKAFITKDKVLATSVINMDDEIDQIEIDVEEECLKILALYQPVAIDLRYIISMLKINIDLERIGDLAVNIAEKVAYHYIAPSDAIMIPFDYKKLVDKVKNMLKDSIDAMVKYDAEKAMEVCKSDDEVDEINAQMHARLREEMHKHPECIEYLLQFISVSRNLERIADHTTNIAEDVIYMKKGRIIRHSGSSQEQKE